MRLLTLLVLVTGCRYGGTFLCDRNEDCGANGTCQSAQYCSFPAEDCTSGQKYDETAGPYAGICVGEEPDRDGGAFDPKTCPATYTITLASTPSRYMIRTALSSFWQHHAACKGDLPGATHLMIPDTSQELVDVIGVTQTMAPGEDEFFVGVAQNVTTAAMPGAEWFNFDGNATNPAFWTAPGPTDVDNNEADHKTNVAIVVRATSHLADATGVAAASPGLCECDGKAVPPQIESLLITDPNHD
ncbi:MAG TPA: hypothetical protein VL326_08860 [Kofleriaceae bacterium]|nr:hypothetical protein [Kofleriaceae bacterium]